MRLYCIDDLTEDNVKRLEATFDANGMKGSMDGMYWLDIPESLYTDEQTAHAAQCGPYSLGIETLENGVRMELLVRARNIIRCSCVAYATPEQRLYAIEWLDSALREQDIPA
ncbi:hypothetical protein GGQ74_000416 [Desulfobaculum xiamenense]|uniref:Uncharacterized protein n=1 Tax=Desulfobaculum xiamenense TaxID=995050 RepID=A0A846QDH1_9BACT|nr:hypothetical protein [Desulfobaculum xiamenense]NJB66776.1 hypothetical protein [Desulfobaculum xiamenense]